MKKILFISLLAVSCTSEKTPFCKCMEAGKNLNDFTEKLWDKEMSNDDEATMKSLKEAKDDLCADYKLMGKEEMLSLQKSCEGSDEMMPE